MGKAFASSMLWLSATPHLCNLKIAGLQSQPDVTSTDAEDAWNSSRMLCSTPATSVHMQQDPSPCIMLQTWLSKKCSTDLATAASNSTGIAKSEQPSL